MANKPLCILNIIQHRGYDVKHKKTNVIQPKKLISRNFNGRNIMEGDEAC